MNRFISNKCGICPVCGKHNLSWGDSDINDSYIGYEYTCDNCGAQGTEYYRLVFDGHGVYNEENHEYDDVNDYVLPGTELTDEEKDEFNKILIDLI